MLLASYWKAFQGFILWNKIDRKYHAPFYLLLPKEKEVSNYYALLHLKRFLQVRGFGEAVVLTCDREAAASLELFLEGQSVGDMVKAVCICRKDAVKLLKYYALNEFTSRLTVVSFTEPYDTHAQNLLGVHGVDWEELVCLDIYRFSEKVETVPPKYMGTEEKVNAFLRRGMWDGWDKKRAEASEKAVQAGRERTGCNREDGAYTEHYGYVKRP